MFGRSRHQPTLAQRLQGAESLQPEALLEFPPRAANGLIWSGLGLVALIAGLFARHSGLAALGLALTVTTVVLGWRAGRSLARYRVGRSTKRSAYEGERVEIDVHLEGAEAARAEFPEVAEIFAPEFSASKHVVFPDVVVEGDRRTQTYAGYCMAPRGVHRIGPTATRVCDVFGATEARRLDRRIELLRVYPSPARLALDPWIGHVVGRIVEDRASKRIGISHEYWAAREYRMGDDIRRLHPRLTARIGYPHVREDSENTTGSMTVLVDGHPASTVGFGRNSSTEVGIRIAVSLGRRILERGRPFSLIHPEREAPNVFRGNRPVDYGRLLDHVVAFRTSDTRPTLEEAIPDLEPHLPRSDTLVVLLSPYTFGRRGVEGALSRWRSRGAEIHVILFEGRDSRRPDESALTAMDERRRLERLGISVYVAVVGDDLESDLAPQLALRGRSSGATGRGAR